LKLCTCAEQRDSRQRGCTGPEGRQALRSHQFRGACPMYVLQLQLRPHAAPACGRPARLAAWARGGCLAWSCLPGALYQK